MGYVEGFVCYFVGYSRCGLGEHAWVSFGEVGASGGRGVRGLLEMGGYGHALIALTVLPVVRSQHPLPLVLYGSIFSRALRYGVLCRRGISDSGCRALRSGYKVNGQWAGWI